MVGHADGDAEVVLGIAGEVGEARADIVQFYGTQAKAFGQTEVHAAAELHGESARAAHRSGRGRKGAVESVRSAKKSLAEDRRRPTGLEQAFGPAAGREVAAGAGHDGDLAEVG